MVFCYKTVTESPRRSGFSSPRKRSPAFRTPILPISLSSFMGQYDYEKSESQNVLDSIQEKDWKLIATLAKKREDEEERDRLADQFHKMWKKEQEERDMVETETQEQYKRYLHEKREQERRWLDHRRLQQELESQLRRGQLISYIQHKDDKSAGLLASQGGKKVTNVLSNAIEEETKAILAASRRLKQEESEEWKKLAELESVQRNIDRARRRRDARLKDTAQRAAISNALSNWGSSVLRQEVSAMEAARRAHHVARIALQEARSYRLACARERQLKRARDTAAFTAQLREAVREGRL